jgi:hypothetical protein
MIYIFVICTNICIYNVFVYGGQWPNILCNFTLYISIRSSIMFLYMVGSGPIFCAYISIRSLWVSSASCACLFWACLLAIMCISTICVSVMCVSSLGKSCCLHLSIRSLWASSASCACLFWACLLAIMCISIICVSVMCVSILGKSGCLHHKVRRRLACRETESDALLSERRRGGVQAAICTTRFEEGLPAGRRSLMRC